MKSSQPGMVRARWSNLVDTQDLAIALTLTHRWKRLGERWEDMLEQCHYF